MISSLFSDDWSISAQLHITETDSLFDDDGIFTGAEQNIIFDTNNFLGMKSDALDGYDGAYDIPEPPHAPDRWISLYFPHSDWNSLFGNDFTSDYKKSDNLSDKVSVWDAKIVSDRQDSLVVMEFDFIDSVQWPVFLKLQDESDLSIFQYYRLEDDDAIEFEYDTDSSYLAQFTVGTNIPGPALDFDAQGGGRQMSLSWKNRVLCLSGSSLDICNNTLNHYDVTGYKIFKNYENNGWGLSHLIALSNHEILFTSDQISDNISESSLSISEYPVNGELLIDCYENYDDSNQDGIYNNGESFEDFGQDGLIETGDLGENDGVCNLELRYVPDSNFIGSDQITVSDSYNQYHQIEVNIIGQWIDFEDGSGYSLIDDNLIGSSFYEYYSVSYNNAGDGMPSSISSDITSPNSFPFADAGDDITFYLYEINQDYLTVTLPYNYLDLYDSELFTDSNGNGFYDIGESFVDANSNGQWDSHNNINQSFDSDGDLLVDYRWEMQLSDGTWEQISDSDTVNVDLEIGSYSFRHQAFDGFNWGFYDYVNVEIEGLPAPAQVSNINVSPNLYYLELNWPQSEYSGDNFPEGYEGNPFLAYRYELHYDEDTLAEFVVESFSDNNGNGLYDFGEFFEDNNGDGVWSDANNFVHNGLEPNTEYCYDIYAFNVQELASLAQSVCGYTGNYPSVEILSPNGGEIIESGSSLQIDYSIENTQYVRNIEVFYRVADGVDLWESIYYSEDISYPIIISAPTVNQIEANNKFKIVVEDVGNFDGENSGTYSDQSDFDFIISSPDLSFNIGQGLNLMGSPLDLGSSSLFQDIFDPYSTIGYLDGFTNNNFNIGLGEGYYIYNFSDDYLTQINLSGDLVFNYNIDLDMGWNLISNPLVADIYLDSLVIGYMGSEYGWAESVSNNLISPILIGYNNAALTHYADNVMEPFKGYWIHAPIEGVSIELQPSIYADTPASNLFDEYDWTIKLISYEQGNDSIKDFIVIGTDSDADESFSYSEDIYDFPVVNFPGGQTNLYIDHSQDWFASNLGDNGLIIESGKFLSDIRTPMTSSSFKRWNIKGESINLGPSSSVVLEWEMDEVGGVYPINMLINGSVVDMRQESSIVMPSEDFGGFLIEIGDESLDNNSPLVEDFNISDPYPNPFNPTTYLSLSIPASSNIDVNIYDVNGSFVDNLYSGYISSGKHMIEWNATHQSSGVYFIQTKYQNSVTLKKAILIK